MVAPRAPTKAAAPVAAAPPVGAPTPAPPAPPASRAPASEVGGWRDDLETCAWDQQRAAALAAAAATTAAGRGKAAGAGRAGAGPSNAADARSNSRPQRARRPPRALADAHVDLDAEQRDVAAAVRNSLAIRSMQTSAELPRVPTYRPTAAEFAQPFAYVASIRQEASRYGAAKIIPPAGWRDAAGAARGLDGEALRFEPRQMPLGKLLQGCGFQMGATTTLAEFEKRAQAFAAEYPEAVAAAKTEVARAGNARGKAAGAAAKAAEAEAEAAEAAVESRFWRAVQTDEGCSLVVPYGADLDSAEVKLHA